MSVFMNVKYFGGDLTKLYNLSTRNHIRNLYIRNGFIHPSYYDEYHQKYGIKFGFPSVHNLFLDRCESNYLFYHTTTKHYFPNLQNLYLRNIPYDFKTLQQATTTNPSIKNVYYVNNCYDKRYTDFQLRIRDNKIKNKDLPSVYKTTNERFWRSLDLAGRYVHMMDETSSNVPIPVASSGLHMIFQ